MKNHILKFTSLLTTGTFFIAGCTNIKDDDRRTKTEGTIAGVGAGALIGGLIGAATGGGSQSVVRGALIGGAAGGYAGHKYGEHVVEKKHGYAANEARLRELIGEARSERVSAERYNASLRGAIAQQRSQLARIRSGQADKGAAAKLRSNVDGNLSQSQAQYDRKEKVASEVRTSLAEAPNGADKQQLQAEYASLQQEKQILGQQIKEMNGIKTQLASASR
jgi:outer membrane lipoprotein SlyB